MNRISGQSRMLIAVAMCLRTYLWHSTRCVFSKYTGQVWFMDHSNLWTPESQLHAGAPLPRQQHLTFGGELSNSHPSKTCEDLPLKPRQAAHGDRLPVRVAVHADVDLGHLHKNTWIHQLNNVF